MQLKQLKAQTPKLKEAMDNHALNHFTLRPSNPLERSLSIMGNIHYFRDGYIYMNLPNEIKINPKGKYDILFHKNRRPFLCQHNAIEFMKEDGVFDSLINEQLYRGAVEQSPQLFPKNYNFW